jgi:hypothetical protein
MISQPENDDFPYKVDFQYVQLILLFINLFDFPNIITIAIPWCFSVFVKITNFFVFLFQNEKKERKKERKKVQKHERIVHLRKVVDKKPSSFVFGRWSCRGEMTSRKIGPPLEVRCCLKLKNWNLLRSVRLG